MFKLGDNWKDILKKAWSVRLMIVAAILTGLEALLPFFAVPKLLMFGLVASGLLARLMAQKDLK
jgi:hypothetical protein